MLHNLKYNYASSIAEAFGLLLAKYFKINTITEFDTNSIIVPVPLHKKRLAERGFNQSELIARQIGKILSLEINTTLLSRIKNTKSQMKLDRSGRIANMQDSFICTDPVTVKGKNVILIDDVLTTGATIKEAAYALKTAGCGSISAIVLAKGGIDASE
jgi:ComF family protein